MRIYIDAGHGGNDSGAVSGEFVEKDINLRVAEHARAYLSDYDCEVFLNRTADRSTRITDMTSEAQRLEVDCYLSIHHNSGGGVGSEVYYWKTDDSAKELASTLLEEFVKLGQRSRGIKESYNASGYRNFGVCRLNAANGIPAVLGEFAFLDSETDRAAIDSDENLSSEGAAYAKAAVSFLSLTRKSPMLFRVQVGPCQSQAGADALLESLSEEGFGGYRKLCSGCYCVQVGAYAKKANAEALLERLKEAGFDAYISET